MTNSVKKEEFISLKDAAKELNVTKFTLRELLYKKEGLIDGFIIDGELSFRKGDFSKVKQKIAELLEQKK